MLPLLPVRTCSDCGAALSFALRRRNALQHRKARALIAKLRPDLATSETELEAAARRVWSSTARVYTELPVMRRIVSAGLVEMVDGEILDEATRGGRPVICLYVHTGNWELSGMQLALRYPNRILAVFAPLGNPAETAFAIRSRGAMPMALAPMSRMVWRQALRHLGRPGGILCLAADEWEGGQVLVPFFGRTPCYDGNLSKVARLALRTGASIVPVYSERHGGRRIRTIVLPALIPDRGVEDEAAAMRAVVDRLEAIFAVPIVRLVDQWYMAPHVGSLPGEFTVRNATR